MHTMDVLCQNERIKGISKRERENAVETGKSFSPVYDIIHALNSRNDHKTNDYYRFACDSRALVIS